MKRSVVFFLLLMAFGTVAAQTETTYDSRGTKIIRGFMSQKELASDTAFAWYAEQQKGYTPDQSAVQAFQKNRDSIHIIAFAGTWCGDTKNILPKFFALTDAAGFSQDRVTLLGVDRSKKTIQHLAEAFQVINVPTIIVLKDGKEIGRVVEYGRYGMFDKELAEILSSN